MGLQEATGHSQHRCWVWPSVIIILLFANATWMTIISNFVMCTEIRFLPGKQAFVQIIVTAANLLAQPRSLYENELCRNYTQELWWINTLGSDSLWWFHVFHSLQNKLFVRRIVQPTTLLLLHLTYSHVPVKAGASCSHGETPPLLGCHKSEDLQIHSHFQVEL